MSDIQLRECEYCGLAGLWVAGEICECRKVRPPSASDLRAIQLRINGWKIGDYAEASHLKYDGVVIIGQLTAISRGTMRGKFFGLVVESSTDKFYVGQRVGWETYLHITNKSHIYNFYISEYEKLLEAANANYNDAEA